MSCKSTKTRHPNHGLRTAVKTDDKRIYHSPSRLPLSLCGFYFTVGGWFSLMKEIQLTHGKTAIVDDDDFEMVSKTKWYADRKGYVKNWKGQKIHRLIAKTPEGMATDHIDGDKLNNQKSNLRICTDMQNKWNRTKTKKNRSGFKGVSPNHGGFQAQIYFKKKHFHLGLFPTAELAHAAYCKAAKELHGEFARTH